MKKRIVTIGGVVVVVLAGIMVWALAASGPAIGEVADPSRIQFISSETAPRDSGNSVQFTVTVDGTR